MCTPPSLATGRRGEACGGTPQGSRPGPYADEHTRQGGGALAGPTGHVPARVLSRTSPDLLASQNTGGTLGRPNGEGRRERCVQVCSANLDTVDTTLTQHKGGTGAAD